ncbi:uncharacterized protein LOC142226963 [Haematobia irritans]
MKPLIRIILCLTVCLIATAHEKIEENEQIEVHIVYCEHSYKEKFDTYANLLSKTHDNVRVSGSFYKPSIKHMIKAITFTIGGFVLSGLIMFPPSWFPKIGGIIKRFIIGLFGFLIVVPSCFRENIKISAFEVYVNDVLKWSTLEKKYVPNIDDIHKMVDPNYIKEITTDDRGPAVFIFVVIIIITLLLSTDSKRPRRPRRY